MSQYGKQWWGQLPFSIITIISCTWWCTKWIRWLVQFVAPQWGTPLTRTIRGKRPCRSWGIILMGCFTTGSPYQYHSGSGGVPPINPPLGLPCTSVIGTALVAFPCMMVPPRSSATHMPPPSVRLPLGTVGIISPPFLWQFYTGLLDKISPSGHSTPSRGGPDKGRQEAHRLHRRMPQSTRLPAQNPKDLPPPRQPSWPSY